MDDGRSAQKGCARCTADGLECTKEGEGDCVRCKNLGQICASERVPPNKSSKPRVLNRYKCDSCRQSKQACTPAEREWNDTLQVKCHRCLQKGLSCSKPSPKSRFSPSRTLETHTTKAVTGQNQPFQIILPPPPLGSPSISSDLPPAKKRGRPSKADVERRQVELVAKGDILPAVDYQPPAENISRPTDAASQIQIPPGASVKRTRTLTGGAEDDRRIRPFSQLVEKGKSSSTTEFPEPNSTRNISHPENATLPIQHLSPANPGSPLRNSNLPLEIEATSPPKTQAGPDSQIVKKLRARANWFRVAEIIKKDNQIKNIAKYLSEIAWGASRVLCGICASMNLTADKFVVNQDPILKVADTSPLSKARYVEGYQNLGPQSIRGKLKLGMLTEIQKRSYKCPFCKLVLYAAQEQAEFDLSDGRSHPNLACFASWQLDGHEIDNNNSETMARTRRIRLRWSNTDIQDSYIVLVAGPEAGYKRNLFLGRELKFESDGSPIDVLPLVKGWIDVCHSHHNHNCGNYGDASVEDMRLRPYFGVVDVQDMKLTSLPRDSIYVALSYTWGKAAVFATTKAHIKSLQEPNGVLKYMDHIPRAVKEAIELVRYLGLRYIWVDSLCIVQDSRDSLWLNLNMMDQIYGNSHFTLCAADNPDATAGLVALHRSMRNAEEKIQVPQRLKQRIEEYAPGVRLMVSQLTEIYVQKTRWSTRGWTFQERVLSTRCLIFAQGQVFFQCRSTAMSEGIWSDSPAAGWSIELSKSPQQMLSSLDERPLQTYAKVVEKYTACKLDSLHTNDILAAFSGICNVLSKGMDAHFVYGMPDVYFDWALLWDPRQHPARRLPHKKHRKRDSKAEKMKQESLSPSWTWSGSSFPSWSWSGWLGTMHYPHTVCPLYHYEMNEWFLRRTWIIWYIRDSRGRLRLVRKPPSASNTAETSVGTGSRDMYGRVKRYPHKDGTEFQKTLPDFPYTIEKADSEGKHDPLHYDLKFLQFWTWSAHFYLSHDDNNKAKLGHGLCRFDILDNKGDWCGSIVLRYDWNARIKKEPAHKFIAISDAMNFSPDEYGTWNFYLPKERELSAWDLFYVYLIVEDDEGIAQRAGLGKVFKEAFSHSCGGEKEWSEFILG